MPNKVSNKKNKADKGARKEPLELLVGPPKHAWPFSRGLLIRTLLHAGASRKEAASIARHVEQFLRDHELSPIRTEDLHALLVRVTKEQGSRPLARRVAQQTPFFQDIQVRSASGKLPFSRSVLARRLDDTGLDTKEAYAAARQVDLYLREKGLREVSAEELQDYAAEVLTRNYGEHFARTYRFILNHQGRVGVISTDSPQDVQPIPFSKGILMQSLLAAGAAPDAARTLARAVQRDLQGQEDRVVTRAQIRRMVQRRLRDEAGKHVSARYGLLRSIRHLPRPLLVLIGGVSGTGKSHLASEVAYRLGIPRIINTDSVREVMRAMVSPQLMPALHTSTFQAWRYLLPPGEERPEHPDRLSLEIGFREQARQVSVGLNAIARRLIHENADLVAEGVHLVPGFLDEQLTKNAIVVPVLLTIPDEDEHRARFARREKEASARPESRYLQNFQEIRGLQEYLIRMAERQGVPILDHLSLDEQAERTVDIVLAQLPAALRELSEEAAGEGDEEEMGFLEYASTLSDLAGGTPAAPAPAEAQKPQS
ncbi:2-phosphoglycerate kinase [Deinococcus piscis]|uniref:2-phosphoglycerate kinase n=1 Tax=Deinococcus piscis TaxID=394230 RepID=A0ABQ3K1J1_9DEIO|nr:ATP cone domain-containing protein [Deinococcus piscis]GHF99713.1 2-phosphoglycerate kinase [Deinococcus piscis]